MTTESSEVRADLSGAELARVLANAYFMVPARAQSQHFMISVAYDFVMAAGTDSYIVGMDYAESQNDGMGGIRVDRETLGEIESLARLKGKKERVILRINTEVNELCLTYQDKESGETVHVYREGQPLETDLWNSIMDMVKREWGDTRPEFVAFNPELFARFAKVKCVPDRVMDLWFAGAGEPALVKVGPTFVGLVMPLERERARTYSPEGLWSHSPLDRQAESQCAQEPQS